MKQFSFSATVEIIGVNPYILIPERILQELFNISKKTKGPIPLIGTIDGHEFTQTLVKYQGLYRLYLNTPMRKTAKKDVGDSVDITISYNPNPKKETIPEMFADILNKNTKAKEAFEKLPPYRQKEILRYMNNIKTEETLKRVIQRVLQHLVGEKDAKYFVLMSYKKK